MGQGNEITRGGKGKNHPHQHNLLQAIGLMITSSGLGATELTAQQILAAIQDHKDFEIKLIRDTGNGDLVICQKVELDETTDTYTTSYVDASGSTYIPGDINLLEYLDPAAVLNLVVAELITLNTVDFATQTTLVATNVLLTSIDSSVATETTLLATNILLTAIDGVLDAIALDTANLDVALSTRASEVTLAATNTLLTTIDTVLDSIKLDTADIKTAVEAINTKLTSVTRVPAMLRVTSAGAASVTAGKRSVSVYNYGNASASWLGSTLLSGERLTWRADGEEDVLGAFTYDALTSSLLILTTT